MSLKHFHVIFIVFAALCDAGFWLWTHLAREVAEEMGVLQLGLLSGWISIGLLFYGVWWILRKSRTIIV